MKNSNRYIFILVLLLAFKFVSQAQESNVLSQRNASYTMDVKLDTEKKVVDGQMQLVWRNISPDTIKDLQFHLYLNGFKNTESTFMEESGGSFRGSSLGKDDLAWGYCDILSMQVKDGENLTGKIRFIHPDNDNAKDQTVIRVPLSDSIMPGQSITINIKFKSKLPKIFARTGYAGNYFFVGQWFPKIGVYEPSGMRNAKMGGWNCHQFHANSEFYADYGVYNVNITVPKDYIVGAVGQLADEKIEGKEKTVKYIANDVIDFAWTASQRYIEINDKWENVNLKLLIQPEHKDLAERHFESVKAALAYYKNHIGEYPYPNLTIVDPPLLGEGSSGMEYPTLITVGFCAAWQPKGLRTVENVAIHEFGHQYFMGIFATNEFEEAWMDEGINSYVETLVMNATYGKNTSMVDFAGIKIGDLELQRSVYVYSAHKQIAESYRFAWDYTEGGYDMMSYQKPATFMTTLHRLVGDDCMDEIMKTYYKRWKFKHPCTQDFIAIVNEIVEKYHKDKFGKDMNWFFNQVLFGNGVCDYRLYKIVNAETEKPIGIFDKGSDKGVDSLKNYNSKVMVSRIGDVTMPVEVLIRFEDGQEITKTWDGSERSYEFKFSTNSKIVYAQIDPTEKLQIDVNFSNNSIQLEQNTNPIWKYTVKFLFWLQNILQTVVWLT